MDKKFIGILLVTMIVVFIASYGCAMFYESNQTANTANPPSPEPAPTPEPTPTPSPSEEPTETASIPKPSVPEFTFEYVDNSYDVPPTYRIDEYTGKTVVDTNGYHVEKMRIEITVKNQPFSYSFNGTEYRLYYNVRVKGHFGDNWRELYPLVDHFSSKSTDEYSKCLSSTSPLQSTSGYTVLSFPANDYPHDAQIDVQVQALVGHDSQVYVIDYAFIYPIGGHWESAVAFDEAGDWSSTQTITIP